MQAVLDAAAYDAEQLTAGGVDAIIVENYGDAPFFPDHVPAITTAAITAAVLHVRSVSHLKVGVNVLRNDAAAALAVCAATGAAFIRINVHSGAMLTDQGWITGRAHQTLRQRTQLGLEAAILADVFVKHAVPAAGLTIEEAARDTWERGCADALILSGSGTGVQTSSADIERVKTAVPESVVFVGSGLTAQNAAALLRLADGAIVGSSLKTDGRPESPVSLQEVQRLVEAARS